MLLWSLAVVCFLCHVFVNCQRVDSILCRGIRCRCGRRRLTTKARRTLTARGLDPDTVATLVAPRRIRQHCSISYQAVAIILPLCLVFPRLNLSYSTLADRGITPLVHVGPTPLLREGLRLLRVCLTAPPFDLRSPAGSRPPRRRHSLSLVGFADSPPPHGAVVEALPRRCAA